MKGEPSLAWYVRYFYALGWVFGDAFGAALVRAFVSGGEWWIFPWPLLIAAAVLPFYRIRQRGAGAELR